MRIRDEVATMALPERKLHEHDPVGAVCFDEYERDRANPLKPSELVEDEVYCTRQITDPTPDSEDYATDVLVRIKKARFVRRLFPFVARKFLKLDVSAVSESGEEMSRNYTQKVDSEGIIFRRNTLGRPIEMGYFPQGGPDEEGIPPLGSPTINEPPVLVAA